MSWKSFWEGVGNGIKEAWDNTTSWIKETFSDVGEDVAHAFGADTATDSSKRTAASDISGWYDKYSQALNSQYKDLISRMTGTEAQAKMLEAAKRSTGTLTSSQAIDSSNLAQVAARTAGLSKAQAAMNANQLIGSSYANNYANNLEGQSEQLDANLQTYLQGQQEILNAKLNQAAGQRDIALAWIEGADRKAMADRGWTGSSWNVRNQRIDDVFGAGASHLTGTTDENEWSSFVANHPGLTEDQLMLAWYNSHLGSQFNDDFLSDSRMKYFMHCDELEIVMLWIMQLLVKFRPQTKEDVLLAKNAAMAIVYANKLRRDYNG